MTIPLELVALALGCCYIYALSRRVDLGLFSLLGVELITIALGDRSQVVGGVHLGPLDAVSISLFFAGIIRTGRSLSRINATRAIVVVYLALFAISLARGFYSNGILVTANESRGFVGPLGATLYFLTAPADEKAIRRYTLAYLYFGGALCAVAVLAAVGAPVGMNALSDAEALGLNGRYLPATGAAGIATCGFLSLALSRYWGKGIVVQLIPVMFMSIAIYLRHRSVWGMLLAGFASLLLLDQRLFRRMLPAAVIAAGVVAALAVYGGNANGLSSESQFSDAATNAQTWEWRLNGWKELLLDEEQTPVTVAIGKSMGSGYWRIDPVSYQAVAVAPHSEYVQEYMRVGVIGALLILLFMLRPLVKLWRLTKIDPIAVFPSTSAWAVILLISLVFGVTYGIGPHAYALIGIANAIVSEWQARVANTEAVQIENTDWEGATASSMAV